MLQVRKANERGTADWGWLQSAHSFSFGRYYDPEQLGHGHLLVINDDVVAPEAGFGTHPHQNMEILSYVTQGVIGHKDSQGNEYEVPAGDFQLMSAGSGITHSEYNMSSEQALHFLQIWIKPNVENTVPGYQQKAFSNNEKRQLIVSPDGEQGSLQIKQQAWLTRLRFQAEDAQSIELNRTGKSYVQVVAGEWLVNDKLLSVGDGLRVEDEAGLLFHSHQDGSEILLFEV